ncbi:metallophosphoesterase [Actinomycetospora sp. TBRC 11914]|uniref:metallophosphoesterase family protein n=1 Tax=Actinomycetospora sp. TBRC 11914 TaxID=2729387 RepID=UPI00145C6EFF|nr:YfcE family phosphodiesterase [Actinomycetospora sp. TBRC 11914]NMO91950.1 YfcE family phosphodiesterase [Actinomycetospora sp. TBRC 11914]
MRLVLVADTHLPSRAKEIPDEVWAAVEAADVVVHAGDWTSPPALDAFEARSARLVACWGNNDGDELRARLPEVARVELGGLRFAVIHETGDARGRERRCDEWFGPASDEPADVVVFGHSHIPWDSTTPGGVRLLNPGSPTDRRRQPVATFLTADVAGGVLTVGRHELPPRVR